MSKRGPLRPLAGGRPRLDNIAVIHLNHAGTSYPKPAVVHRAVREALAAGPGQWPALHQQAHAEVCEFLGIEDHARFLLTSGCTASLALIFTDLPWSSGDRILTSGLEHHALARWPRVLAEQGVKHATSPYAPGQPLDLSWLEEQLRAGGVRLVACTAASNVTGECLPVVEIVALARHYGALCLIDAAQVVGRRPLDVRELAPDLLVFAGHKGPLGPHGIGGLYAAPHVQLRSPAAACDLRAGAAGACQPFPGYCDVGSVNLAGAAGLRAGLAWLRERGLHEVRAHIDALTQRLLAGLRPLSWLQIHGSQEPDTGIGVISLSSRTPGITPGALERQLADAGIAARAGHHCAPMAHETLGSQEHGTLRLSVGATSESSDVDAALDCLAAIGG